MAKSAGSACADAKAGPARLKIQSLPACSSEAGVRVGCARSSGVVVPSFVPPGGLDQRGAGGSRHRRMVSSRFLGSPVGARRDRALSREARRRLGAVLASINASMIVFAGLTLCRGGVSNCELIVIASVRVQVRPVQRKPPGLLFVGLRLLAMTAREVRYPGSPARPKFSTMRLVAEITCGRAPAGQRDAMHSLLGRPAE